MKASLIRNLERLERQLKLEGYDVKLYIKNERQEYLMIIKLKEGDAEDIMNDNIKQVEGG